jgi:O-methyltransferase involved in polyketide biosynthesis
VSPTPTEPVTLTGVPETLLWTLWYRAAEARRPDTVLHDPLAVELVDGIDYPFQERFGTPFPLQAQGQALRCTAFDLEVRRFLAAHPGALVVALGEGLETQLWRVDDGRLRWLTVDLAEGIDVRRRVLPAHERARLLACSVLERGWLDEVVDGGAGEPVLLSAEGLLMYLEPDQVHGLIAELARRLPGSTLVLDAVPRWLSARTMQGLVTPSGYRSPGMPWALDAVERRRLAELPGVASVEELPLPRGRGLFFGHLRPARAARLPRPLQVLAPWHVLRLEFAARHPQALRRAATPAGR